MGIFRKMCTLFFLTAAISALTACGKQDHQRGIDGYVYVAEDAGQVSGFRQSFQDTNLYYMERGTLYMTALTTDDKGSPAFDKPIEFADIQGADYATSQDQEVYCFHARKQNPYPGTTHMTNGRLVKYRADRTVDYILLLRDLDAQYTTYSADSHIAVDSSKRVFLLGGDVIYVVDDTGSLIHEIDIAACRSGTDVGDERLFQGADGRIYYFVYSRRSGYVLDFYEIRASGGDFQALRLSGEEWERLRQISGTFYNSPYGLLFSGSDGILHQYDHEHDKWREVLRWSDSNLKGSNTLVAQIDENRYLVQCFGQDTIYILTKTSVKEVPEKEEMILACYYDLPEQLEEMMLQFNRASDRYHISARIYQGEEGLMRLDASLVSSEPPDLLEMTYLDEWKYASNGGLEDLSPYLESSSVLDKESYLDGIIRDYTVNGRLVAIPSYFHFSTLTARRSQAGAKAGWTMEDIMALEEKYPSYSLMDGFGFSLSLELIYIDYIADRFIDWETGECRFDSQEFCDLMEWLAERSVGIYFDMNHKATQEVLISRNVFYRPFDFKIYDADFDNEMIMMGYPTADGRVLHHAQAREIVGIVSKSKNKEGAWAFLELFLSHSGQSEYTYGFPSRRDWLEQMLEDAMTPEYAKDVHGNIYLDENGMPLELPKYIDRAWGSLEEEKYGPLTEDETDWIRKVIQEIDFTPKRDYEWNLQSIIMEEMASYFNRQKTLEEVARVIQNRARLLVQENLAR